MDVTVQEFCCEHEYKGNGDYKTKAETARNGIIIGPSAVLANHVLRCSKF